MAIGSSPTVAHDYRLGFVSLGDEIALDELPVQGRLPGWLRGTLLRTGPARFEAGGRSLRHWFDGLAMLHRFGIADGRVSYANRALHSAAWRAVQERGELSYSEFATDPCRSLFKRVASAFSPALTDNANVNVARLGEEFIAMTETPMPIRFDPATLEAAGVAYKAPGQLTTAHPHHDPQRGELVNLAVALGPRSHYRFFAQRDRREQRRLASHAVREPSYVHSFGCTERHLVLAEGSLFVNPLRLALSGRPFIENYRWHPERGGRLLVFDRASGRLSRTAETPPFFCFHHVNAFERGDELVVDLLAYEDDEIVRALYLDRLRSGTQVSVPAARLRRYVVGPQGGSARIEDVGEHLLELPRINYAGSNGRPYRYLYGAGYDGEWLDRVVKVDLDRGEQRVWSDPGCYPGEPIFVAAPGGEDEDDGVLLTITLDAAQARSCLIVLDARTLHELARAAVPHVIPHSFHGQFSTTA
jgi:carotenoid cleavage dioxygenase-like enzyme